MLLKTMIGFVFSLLLVHLSAANNWNYPTLLKLVLNETFLQQFNEYVRLIGKDGTEPPEIFPCKPYPTPVTKTTSVHKLRPADVRVVAALGDSITAGTGIKATTLLGLLRENRGLSWSIGGDGTIEEEVTLPNMLKVYNPNLAGFSLGTGSVEQESVSHFNVANPGDKAEDVPGQAEKLIQRMIHDRNVNFTEDWKVITIFVGGNDLCDFCDDKETYSAESYIGHLERALDILHQQVPRAFVNLVPVLNISIVKELNTDIVCDVLHLYLCSCAAFPMSSESEKELQNEIIKYQNYTQQLVDSGKYDTRDDFTVVIQPFFIDSRPPKKPNGEADGSYFAPDCFHLNRKGHREAAKALWNNMIEPIGQKRTKWSPGESFECPSDDHPYLYTGKNSGAFDAGLKTSQVYESTSQSVTKQTIQNAKTDLQGNSNNDTRKHFGDLDASLKTKRMYESTSPSVRNTASPDIRGSSNMGTVSAVTVVIVCLLLAVILAVIKWKTS